MLRSLTVLALLLPPLLLVGGCPATTPTDTDTDETPTPDLGISGRINPSEAAKRRARLQDAAPVYQVVAQSAETMQIYRAMTDESGAFALDIPPTEEGNLFLVTILNEQGRADGPLVFAANGDEGATGLDLTRSADLGTIDMPEDPAAAALKPGSDADVADLVAADVIARLDQNGVPIGVGSVGKGSAAAGDTTDNPRQMCDRDQDGLPDFADADNDGDGIVDDFDTDGGDMPAADGVSLNCFMNLKIGAEDADTYYAGSTVDITSVLKQDIILTFEVGKQTADGRTITGAAIVDMPAPTYLPACTTLIDDGTMLVETLWSDVNYELNATGDRYQAFVVPNDTISAGDTFTCEVVFDDGTTAQYARMINYVFRNIPKLTRVGPSGAVADYDNAQPIEFDGAQDLELVFQPPVDETGAFITKLDYRFEVFFNRADTGAQVQNIDGASTWPTAPSGFDTGVRSFDVRAADLTLSADNTYTVTLPREIFVDTVTLTDATSAAVGGYKIDIAAQNNGNNAAIMLAFRKQ